MKFKIESTALGEVLDVVGRALPKGAVIIPTTAGVLIDAKDKGDGEGEVVFKATNLTLGAIVSTDMVEVMEEGIVLVDASKLVGMVGKFKGTITFNEKEGGEKVLCTAKGRRATLSTMNPEDYPRVEIAAESNVTLTGKGFVENVGRIDGFAADLDTILQGMNMRFGEKLTLTAIDGFAVGRVVVDPIESGEVDNGDQVEITVVAKQLVEASRAVEKCEQVEVGVSENKLYITGALHHEDEGSVFISLMSLALSGDYPPSVDDIITDGKEKCERGSMVVCSVKELEDAFDPVKLVEDTPFFTLEVVGDKESDEGDAVILQCQDAHDSYNAIVSVEDVLNQGEKVGLNKKYMGLVLKNIKSDSVLMYVTKDRLLVVDGDVGDAYTQIVMGLTYDDYDDE